MEMTRGYLAVIIIIHASGTAQWMAVSVGPSTTFVQTEISLTLDSY